MNFATNVVLCVVVTIIIIGASGTYGVAQCERIDRSIDHEFAFGNVSKTRKSVQIVQTASIRDIALIGTNVRFRVKNRTFVPISTMSRIEAIFAICTDREPLLFLTKYDIFHLGGKKEVSISVRTQLFF